VGANHVDHVRHRGAVTDLDQALRGLIPDLGIAVGERSGELLQIALVDQFLDVGRAEQRDRVNLPGDQMTAYTIGHSTRTPDELLALLGDAGVRLIADVRAFPGSRRHPQFNRSELARWLPRAGIRYVHMAGLGGRRDPVPGSPNGGWEERGFRGYADYMGSPEFRAALADLEAAATQSPSAVMCAERVWWRCHRRLIADALVVRGWQVEHLGIGATRTRHELTPFARVGADGAITYPPPQITLLES
jgi:hypothetical protein